MSASHNQHACEGMVAPPQKLPHVFDTDNEEDELACILYIIERSYHAVVRYTHKPMVTC